MSEAVHEAMLSDAEVATILSCCGSDALLVGGQALALWANYFGVIAVAPLVPNITTDADFIGTREVAARLQTALGRTWSLRTATLDDVGAQVAKVYTRVPEGAKQVDFLSGVVGIDTAALQRRAAQIVRSDGTTVRVIHPLDVLESRLRNLAILPSKRTQIGVAQASLAIQVVRQFLSDELVVTPPSRVVFSAVRRVIQLGTDARLAPVAFDFNLDILSAVPAERISSASFQREAWPRALEAVAQRRQRHVALQARRDAIHARKSREPD